jgi:hypothetical protein
VTSQKTSPAQRLKKANVKEDVLAQQFNSAQGAPIERNMFVKSDVINYARNFSSGVTGVKNMAKSLSNNADYIKFAAHSEGMESAIDWLKEEAADFADAFNKANDFAKNQKHSAAVADFADDVAGILLDDADEVGSAGLSFIDGKLSFNEEIVNDFSYSRLSAVLDGIAETANKIYKTASDFLQTPLSDHMGFKSLSYYYDYRLGGIAHNNMNIVSSGMIIDVTI